MRKMVLQLKKQYYALGCVQDAGLEDLAYQLEMSTLTVHDIINEQKGDIEDTLEGDV